MKETDQELGRSLMVQLSLLKLISGSEEGLKDRTPTDRDARTLEQFVRAVSPEAA